MIDWDILYKISLGLYVLGAKGDTKDVGSIVDAVMVAANKPCALAISCNNASYTKDCIEKNKHLVLSVLPKNVDPKIIATFGFRSSKDFDKWNNVKSARFDNLPVLEDAVAYISAKVIHQYVLDSNTIFVAEISDMKLNKEAPLLLYQDYRGKLKDEVLRAFRNNGDNKMEKKWVCTVCNYVYDGETPFEELGDDYVCPLCGVDKSFFEQRDV